MQFNILEKPMNTKSSRTQLQRKGIALMLGGLLAATAACTAVEDAIVRAELDGTSWQAVSIDGFAVPEGVEVTMNFDMDGDVSGSAGCNSYTVDDVQTVSGVKFIRIATTRKLCPEPQMTTETLFVDALGQVTNFRHNRDGQLILFGRDVTLLFDPTS